MKQHVLFFSVIVLLVSALCYAGGRNIHQDKQIEQGTHKKKKKSGLQIGDKAPEFSLQDETGIVRNLSEMNDKKIVVYFYPQDDTPGCRKEACSIRDGYSDLQREGIHVWGVSYDSVKSHKKFKEKYHLTFSLLSDVDHKVSELYGVSGMFWPSRVTFLINESGYIISILKNVDVSAHADQIIKAFAKK